MHDNRRHVDSHSGRTAELGKMLEERQQELVNDLQQRVRQRRASAESSAAGDVLDTADLAEVDIQDELSFALMQMKAETLEHVRRAIARLHSGDFGLCVECDGEITERRLRALPSAVPLIAPVVPSTNARSRSPTAML